MSSQRRFTTIFVPVASANEALSVLQQVQHRSSQSTEPPVKCAQPFNREDVPPACSPTCRYGGLVFGSSMCCQNLDLYQDVHLVVQCHQAVGLPGLSRFRQSRWVFDMAY
jgi:hypothetical protein